MEESPLDLILGKKRLHSLISTNVTIRRLVPVGLLVNIFIMSEVFCTVSIVRKIMAPILTRPTVFLQFYQSYDYVL